jgi:hypothetical protein
MGLLDGILLAPILGPIKGLYFVGKKVRDMAIEELMDEDKVRQELRGLYVSLEKGEIDEQEFEDREEELVELLEEIMSYKENSG